MSNYLPFSEDDSSLALLALRRFVRGTLRQVGLGLMSLVLILNLSAPATAKGTAVDLGQRVTHRVSTFEQPSQLRKPVSEGLMSEGLTSEQSFKESSSDADLKKPFHLLKPRMTHHRLTSARLFIPSSTEQIVASLAEAD